MSGREGLREGVNVVAVKVVQEGRRIDWPRDWPPSSSARAPARLPADGTLD